MQNLHVYPRIRAIRVKLPAVSLWVQKIVIVGCAGSAVVGSTLEDTTQSWLRTEQVVMHSETLMILKCTFDA